MSKNKLETKDNELFALESASADFSFSSSSSPVAFDRLFFNDPEELDFLSFFRGEITASINLERLSSWPIVSASLDPLDDSTNKMRLQPHTKANSPRKRKYS